MTGFKEGFSARLALVQGPLTQKDFAREVGICRDTLAGYLIGRTTPSAEILHQICETTGCSSDWLLGLSEAEWKKIHPSGIYECSTCGTNVMTDDIAAYHYCHGCGRRMRPYGINHRRVL